MAGILGLQLLAGEGGRSLTSAEAAAVSKVGSDLSFGRSNYLGALIVLGIVASVVAWRNGPRAVRVLVALTAPFSISGLYLTGSKTQTITFLLLTVPGLLLATRHRVLGRGTGGRAIALLLLLLGAWAAVPYLKVMFATVARTGVTGYRTVDQRQSIWSDVFSQILESPLVGVGLQNLSWLGQYSMAHNTFLQVAGETGFVGLLLYLWLLWVVARGAADRPAVLFVLYAIVLSGVAENTLRTREYDFVAWTLFAVVSYSCSSRPKTTSSGRP